MECRRTSERKAKNAASSLIRRVTSGRDIGDSVGSDAISNPVLKKNELDVQPPTRSSRKMLDRKQVQSANVPENLKVVSSVEAAKPGTGLDAILAASQVTASESECKSRSVYGSHSADTHPTRVALIGSPKTLRSSRSKAVERGINLFACIKSSLPVVGCTPLDNVPCRTGEENLVHDTMLLSSDAKSMSSAVMEALEENEIVSSSQSSCITAICDSHYGSDSTSVSDSIQADSLPSSQETSSQNPPEDIVVRSPVKNLPAVCFLDSDKSSNIMTGHVSDIPFDNNENKIICKSATMDENQDDNLPATCFPQVASCSISDSSESANSAITKRIRYPSCEQNAFLGGFGLAKKSELPAPQDGSMGNRLHREIGGKLRRCIKPNVEPSMVYRNSHHQHSSKPPPAQHSSSETAHHHMDVDVTAVGKSDSATNIVSVDGLQSRGLNRRTSKHPVKRLASADSVGRGSKSNTPSQSPLKSSHHASPRRTVSARDATPSKLERVSPLDVLADTALADLAAMQAAENSCSQSPPSSPPELPLHVHQTKTSVPSSKPTAATANDEAQQGVRRSSRNAGGKRRVWHHLLRANPDEHEDDDSQSTTASDDPPHPSELQRTTKPVSASKSIPSPFTNHAKPELDTASKFPDYGNAGNDSPIKLKSTDRSQSVARKRQRQSGGGPATPTAMETHSAKRLRPTCSSSVALTPKEHSNFSHFEHNAIQSMVDVDRVGAMYGFDAAIKGDEFYNTPFEESSILSYSYKELECLTPHMCNVCWVNDHMYCRNMKRIARDLPHYSGCIHYIACEHFRNADYQQRGSHSQLNLSSPSSSQLHLGTSFHWNSGLHAGNSEPQRSVSGDDLLCTEEMLDSDADASNHSIEGTELLEIQLRARTAQIFRSLGVNELPSAVSPPPAPREPELMDSRLDNTLIEPEEYAAEVFVDEDGGECRRYPVCDNTDFDDISVPPDVIKFEREETVKTQPLPVDYSHYTSNGNQRSDRSLVSSPPPNHRLVEVEIQRLTTENVLFTYPRNDSGELLQLEVSFPGGATDDAINEFLQNDALQHMNVSFSANSNCLNFPVDGSSDRFSSSRLDGSKILMVKPKRWEAIEDCDREMKGSSGVGFLNNDRKNFQGKRRKPLTTGNASIPLDLRTNIDRDLKTESCENGGASSSRRTNSEISKLRADLSRKKQMYTALMQDIARTKDELRSRQAQIQKYDEENYSLKRQYETLRGKLSSINSDLKQGQQFIDLLNALTNPLITPLDPPSPSATHAAVNPIPVQALGIVSSNSANIPGVSSSTESPNFSAFASAVNLVAASKPTLGPNFGKRLYGLTQDRTLAVASRAVRPVVSHASLTPLRSSHSQPGIPPSKPKDAATGRNMVGRAPQTPQTVHAVHLTVPPGPSCGFVPFPATSPTMSAPVMLPATTNGSPVTLVHFGNQNGIVTLPYSVVLSNASQVIGSSGALPVRNFPCPGSVSFSMTNSVPFARSVQTAPILSTVISSVLPIAQNFVPVVSKPMAHFSTTSRVVAKTSALSCPSIAHYATIATSVVSSAFSPTPISTSISSASVTPSKRLTTSRQLLEASSPSSAGKSTLVTTSSAKTCISFPSNTGDDSDPESFTGYVASAQDFRQAVTNVLTPEPSCSSQD